MSANNQILIKFHNGAYYVFETMAESWDDENILSVKEASDVFDTGVMAFIYAKELEAKNETEYGIHLNYLAKDNCGVTLIDI